MERLSIDEVIEHCKRHTERMENHSGRMQLEETPIGNSNIMKQYWEHRQVAEWLEQLKSYKDAEEQGLISRLSCKVGDKVYVKATCECVCIPKDFETGVSECPFEDDCTFEKCEDGNERIFKTSVISIWNNGNGWYFNVRGLCVDIAFRDIGTSVFLTRQEVEQALKRMESK